MKQKISSIVNGVLRSKQIIQVTKNLKLGFLPNNNNSVIIKVHVFCSGIAIHNVTTSSHDNVESGLYSKAKASLIMLTLELKV